MGDIIPFPERKNSANRARGASPMPPLKAKLKGVESAFQRHAPDEHARDTRAKINWLATVWFMVVDKNLPQSETELMQVVDALHEAVERIATEMGGPERFKYIFRSVSVYLSQPGLGWTKSVGSTYFDFMLPNSASAVEIENYLRDRLPRH